MSILMIRASYVTSNSSQIIENSTIYSQLYLAELRNVFLDSLKTCVRYAEKSYDMFGVGFGVTSNMLITLESSTLIVRKKVF